jgi:tetratricopeptide (TPR) repeat protein
MSDLRIETWRMPAARLGRENPLPPLFTLPSATAGEEVDESVAQEDRRYFGYGLGAGWLPHRLQDDYDRARQDRSFLAIVLENDVLRATFLPEVGGRLWSLVHKPSKRELLHVNPVFQPGNLAVRGAWISSGVEWNACVYGHTPYTCSPLFAAIVRAGDGRQILRLYEWDRTRGVPFQLDVSLPDGSPFLLIRVRLFNPHGQTVPMYWWSNIEVPEAPDVRVIAPASLAYTYEYWGKVFAVSIPEHEGLDVTYAQNIPFAGDYFFRLPDHERPWIAALDGAGRGLIQTSTARQKGRKLYVWGMNPGGRRWQEFLSVPGRACLEIQAGLARTQMECLPMPADAQWDWMEAYGLMEADPAKVHGPHWDAAIAEVAGRLERALPRDFLEAELDRTSELAGRPPEEIVLRGSGWGALERLRRERAGERSFCSVGLVFDDASLGDDQQPWLSLLAQGDFPSRAPDAEPGAWMVQPEWRSLLEQAIGQGRGDHWLGWLHVGLMRFAADERDPAREAWQHSTRLAPSAWAFRNLAQLARLDGDMPRAVEFYQRACQLAPPLRPLATEYCEVLLAANRPRQAIQAIQSLPEAIRAHSRIRLLEAQAGLMLGELQRVTPVLAEDFELVDLREGETSLSDLWFAYQAARLAQKGRPPADSSPEDLQSRLPPPKHLDFRVTPHGVHPK